jgi:PLP dependent protein
MSKTSSVSQNLADVAQKISDAAQTANRSNEITLVAVSKTFSAEDIRPALEAGHRTFGENRVQEAAGKWPALKTEYGDVELHLIGPLQTNKLSAALALFDVIETLDRKKLANALAAEQAKGVSLPLLFIQINTGAEPQKAGILPEEADDFVKFCRDGLSLPVVGLMCIPPVDEEPSLHFVLLEKIARRNGLHALSMGMSADFETAVEFGASHIRVGSAIFGQR